MVDIGTFDNFLKRTGLHFNNMYFDDSYEMSGRPGTFIAAFRFPGMDEYEAEDLVDSMGEEATEDDGEFLYEGIFAVDFHRNMIGGSGPYIKAEFSYAG
jgi:hypothetical protein